MQATAQAAVESVRRFLGSNPDAETARHLEIAKENGTLSQQDRDGMAHYVRFHRGELGAERARYIWRMVYSYIPDPSIR